MLHTNLIGDRASAAQRLAAGLADGPAGTLMVGLGAVFIPLLLSGILSARATGSGRSSRNGWRWPRRWRGIRP